MIGVIDYGAGNLRSVKKALDFLGVKNRVIDDPAALNGIDKMLLPGVGAFQASVEQLQKKSLFNPVRKWLQADRPFLGICLGMQVLFQDGEENPGITALGIVNGSVPRFRHERVPQIGWNKVFFTGETPLANGLGDDAYFYFLHGYYVAPDDPAVVVGETEYGIRYPSMIARGNMTAVQFHPEKSGENGLTLLKNWVEI